MASTTLIAYATKHDSTHRVAELVADVLRSDGLEVDVAPASAVSDVEPYASVVIGGALYMGRWHRDARHLLHRQRRSLAQRPVFVFAMGPPDLEEKSVTGARKQLDHALAGVPEVQPVASAIFGGVVHPEDLRFPFDHMPETNALDPDAVRAWAHEVASALKAGLATTAAR
jgi:menaquinone-dependent protoporphyrinogen IX oxidase